VSISRQYAVTVWGTAFAKIIPNRQFGHSYGTLEEEISDTEVSWHAPLGFSVRVQAVANLLLHSHCPRVTQAACPIPTMKQWEA